MSRSLSIDVGLGGGGKSRGVGQRTTADDFIDAFDIVLHRIIAMIATPKCVMLFACFALTLGSATDSMAQARPPQILEISRDYLKPEAVAANRRLERRAEALCRKLGFTHPYLTIESVSRPAEMWYLNGFDSQAEVEKLTREYQQNTKLVAALDQIVEQKAPLKRAESTDEFAHYRPDLSRGDPWIIGRGQFFVIALFDGDPPMNGTVFEMKDGSRLLVRTAQTSSEARVLVASAGSTARVFRSFFYFRPTEAHDDNPSPT
jgi:hypothetical protein